MKRLLILLVLFILVGCSKDKLENIEIDKNRFITPYDSVAIGIAENGVYYIKDGVLNYKENNGEVIPIGPIDYVDGERMKISGSSPKVQMDMYSGYDFTCYGERIYMQYNTRTNDGQDYYQLASVDLKGDDFKTHIIFDYMPRTFKITNGKIYVEYYNHETNESYIEIYNQYFELIDTRYFDYIFNFHIENDELFVTDSGIIYTNDNIKIMNKYEDYSDFTYHSTGIIQFDDKEFSFDNKSVLFVNDKYFYVVSDTYPQTYERYHLNGELDKSIVINEHIESEGTLSSFNNIDFGYILKLKDENIGYGYSGNDYYTRIFEVNFEEGTCHYLDE